MRNTNLHIKETLEHLPTSPGVYKYYNEDGKIIYIGKAKNLKRRVSSYFQKDYQSSKTRQLVSHIRKIEYILVDSEQDAFLLENNLIKQYQPHYNILLKDGKSYPSICITNEAYPRIYKTRKIDKSIGEYYGPYSFGNTVDMVIELIHQLYPLRTCNLNISANKSVTNHNRVCLKYHLNKCCGICEYKKGSESYNQWIIEAKHIIQGNAQQIIRDLYGQMNHWSQQLEYEKAGEIKRKIDLLQNFASKTIITNNTVGDVDVMGYEEDGDHIYIGILRVHNGSIIQGQTVEYIRKLDENKEELLAFGIHDLQMMLGSSVKDVIVPFLPNQYDETLHIYIATIGTRKKLLELAHKNVLQYKLTHIQQRDKLNPDQRSMRVLCELQNLLGLSHPPVFIDSFDNSHIQGSQAVSACIVYRKARPSKKEYKRFEIHKADKQDDYGQMREVVYRRYNDLVATNGELPDLILVDGGEGQMMAAKEVVEKQLRLNIPVAGLKKDSHHRTQVLLWGDPISEIGMPIRSEVFKLLTQIQDEVHRFAISYHKKKRSKAQINSQFDDIQGVGEIIKQRLLLYFGSYENAKRGKEEEYQRLLGTKRGSAIYGQIIAHLTH